MTGSHKATEELDAVWLSRDTIEVNNSEQHPAADGSAESAAVCTKVVGEDHSRVAQLLLLRGQTLPIYCITAPHQEDPYLWGGL